MQHYYFLFIKALTICLLSVGNIAFTPYYYNTNLALCISIDYSSQRVKPS